MKLKLILALLFSLLSLGCYAQPASESSGPQGGDGNKSLQLQSGEITPKGVPVNINLPKGYSYVDGASARNILTSWGNSAEAVENVFGMILPSSTKTADDIEQSWILSYKDAGHVKDDEAAGMGFSWILEAMGYNYHGDYNKIIWAWNPKYSPDQHLLSLPVLLINGTDSILDYRQFLFGNTGMVIVQTMEPAPDREWFARNKDLVTKGITFLPGSRYEDFNPESQDYAFESVSAFLKGIPSAPQSRADEADLLKSEAEAKAKAVEDAKVSSFLDMVIKGIATVAIVLGAIMLLLMALVFITNSKKESSGSISRLGINVLLRIGVFGVVYLLILTFAIFLVWGAGWLTIVFLSNGFSIKLILAIIGGWFILGRFLWTIVKSLFVFNRNQPNARLEISKSDSPMLMSLVKEVSEAAGEEMPKHTYVSPDVNAYVFYENSFLGIFSLSRKNLVVGLGLLYGLNRQELKAILAHEYGHFGQRSMQVTQVTSICFNIISNLVNAEGSSIVHPILKQTFLYVQRGYMKLSRAMEYEADEKSAAIVGKSATISALCKTEVIDLRFDIYTKLLNGIYRSKHILPESFWSGYELFNSISDDFDGITLNENTISAPLIKTAKSRVKLKDPWISHPLLEQRIENIRRGNSNDTECQIDTAKNIVSPEIFKKVSDILMAFSGASDVKIYQGESYKELLVKELDERSFPRSMRVFFNRDIYEFDLNSVESGIETDSATVFSSSNSEVVETFTQAISDYQTMQMFQNKQISEKEIQYDGKVYTRKNVPVEAQYELIKEYEPQVIAIDKAVFALARSKAQDKNLIVQAYDNIFYSQTMIRHIQEEIIPLRDSVAKQIPTGGNIDEEMFNKIQIQLLYFKDDLIMMIKNIQVERLYPVMHFEMAEELKKVEDERLLKGSIIIGEEVQYVLSLPDMVIGVFRDLAYYSKKIVTDTIEGKKPLMEWDNSVAQTQSKRRATEGEPTGINLTKG